MFAHLQVIAGPDKGRIIPLRADAPVLIGRGRQTETRLNDLYTSRVHCKLEVRGAAIVLSDCNSVSGTFVNDQPITECTLKAGDVIQIGETKMRLQFEDISERSTLPPDRAKPGDRPVPAFPPAVPASFDPAPPPPPSGKTRVRIPVPDPAGPVRVRPLGELCGTILAHFQLTEIMARGTSGVVFQAIDLNDNTLVALKVLRPELARDTNAIQRFVRSMRTMLPLQHPNLVNLFGAGKKGPYCWISMEFIQGESLTQVIQHLGVAGMLDWRNAFRVAVHVGRALEYAHQHQIIHRNLTPQNIMVRSEDKLAKLGDLMLAKAMEGSLAQQLTQPGELLGDIRYMSPERTEGIETLDGRSDIYSLGALVYALLTGRPPLEGSSLVETMTMIRMVKPEPPKKFQLTIPDLFQGSVMRMLAKRPEDRYQTATELLTDLDRVAKFQGLKF